MTQLIMRLAGVTRGCIFSFSTPSLKKNQQGFSLVELMVAVGIMGGLSTVAVPQYGKYKVKAAHTEVKATLANVHAAQALHMVDKNVYTEKIKGDLKIDLNGTNGTYTYGKTPVAAGTVVPLTTTTSGDGNAEVPTSKVKFHVVASAKHKLAGCASSPKRDLWCLNQDKHISNDETAPDADTCVKALKNNGGKDC